MRSSTNLYAFLLCVSALFIAGGASLLWGIWLFQGGVLVNPGIKVEDKAVSSEMWGLTALGVLLVITGWRAASFLHPHR